MISVLKTYPHADFDPNLEKRNEKYLCERHPSRL